MNKSDLIEHMAADAVISKAAASRALNSALMTIRQHLKKGGVVAIADFGIFRVTKRTARMGRNPRSGVPLKIKAAKVPKFTPYKRLKDELN